MKIRSITRGIVSRIVRKSSLLAVCSILPLASISAATPHWDVSGPGIVDIYGGGDVHLCSPMVAKDGVLYAVNELDDGSQSPIHKDFVRWTKCNPWKSLSGLPETG